jgi:DNA-directed RNA polymerase subunit RPC12/RpoP
MERKVPIIGNDIMSSYNARDCWKKVPDKLLTAKSESILCTCGGSDFQPCLIPGLEKILYRCTNCHRLLKV